MLAGRRILVTGGARGLGAAAVDRMAEAGATGVVLDLPPAAETGPWPHISGDVTDSNSVRNAVTEAQRLLGGIDGLLLAAGVVPPWQHVGDIDMAEWDRVTAINVRGVIDVIRCAAPVLEDGSAITVIASLNSWKGDPRIAAYVASKHAVLGIVRSAALDLGPRGIRVNAVAPGPIATEALLSRMAARQGLTNLTVEQALATAAGDTALGRMATTTDVANAIVFLTSDLAAGITGHLLPVDSGVL
jgi:NAD(P)-dependent dehydrogenase (short-subunit alcohol dehydrogenase family)